VCGRTACTVRRAGAGNGTLLRHRASPRPNPHVKGSGEINYLSFAPDSRRLLVGSSGLNLLTLDHGETQMTTLAPADSRRSQGDFPASYMDAIWSADGGTVVTLHGRDGVSSWNVMTGQRIRQGQPWPQNHVGRALIDEGVALVEGESGVALVDTGSGSVRRTIDGIGEPYAISPDRARLVSGGGSVTGGIALWDLLSGARIASAQPTTTPVQSLAFSRDGAAIALGAADRHITILDGRTLATRDRLAGHASDIYGLTFRSATELWSVSVDGNAIAWDLRAAGGVARTLTDNLGETGSGRVSPDASLVAYTTPDGGIRVYDVESQTQVLDIPEAIREGGYDSDWPADGRVFAALDYLGNARVIDVASRRAFPPIKEAPTSNALALSEDGSMLVAGTRQGISVWDVATAAKVRSAHTAVWLLGVEIDPAGRWIFAATAGQEVIVFDAATLEQEVTLDIGANPLAFALSPDGRTLAVSTVDATIRFFDTGSWRQVDQVAVGEEAGIITYDHSGNRFAAAGIGGELTVWDGRNHTQLAEFAQEQGFIGYVGFSADDSTLVTLTRAGRIMAWNLSTSAVVAQHHACAVARRDLTRTEWNQYLPDRPYERTCTSN